MQARSIAPPRASAFRCIQCNDIAGQCNGSTQSATGTRSRHPVARDHRRLLTGGPVALTHSDQVHSTASLIASSGK